MAGFLFGDPNLGIVNGVIPTKYKRVPCPVVGNMYIWLRVVHLIPISRSASSTRAAPGSIVNVEAQLADGTWLTLHRDTNYTSARPQERYGTWVVAQGAGPFLLPMSLRITSPTGQAVEATGAITSWVPTIPSQIQRCTILILECSSSEFRPLRFPFSCWSWRRGSAH